jgi:hypothetical protein
MPVQIAYPYVELTFDSKGKPADANQLKRRSMVSSRRR